MAKISFKNAGVITLVASSVMMILNCGGTSSPKDSLEVKDPQAYRLEHPSIVLHDSAHYNSVIDKISDNSWVFNSHTNSLCVGKLNSACRKSDANFSEGVREAKEVTKLTFEFMVAEYNIRYPADWVIVYQDWVLIEPGDTNGNHPITTLKLKTFDDVLYLCHYDNAWQWGYDYGDNVDGTAIDVDHSRHKKNTKNGCVQIDQTTTYNIEIFTWNSGRFIFRVNGVTVSDKVYQTKSPAQPHVIQWGLYWSKGYNITNDPLSRIVVRFDNFRRYAARE